MKKQKTKELLMEKGGGLMLRKGYNNTGIQEIVDACRVPKGSFYFYFESKEMFGIEMINKFASELDVRMDKFLTDRSLSVSEQILSFFENSFNELSKNDFKGGSLIGKFSSELADVNEMFRQALSLVYNHIAGKITEKIDSSGVNISGLHNSELAAYLVFSWESTLLRMKLEKSIQPARSFIAVAEKLLKN